MIMGMWLFFNKFGNCESSEEQTPSGTLSGTGCRHHLNLPAKARKYVFKSNMHVITHTIQQQLVNVVQNWSLAINKNRRPAHRRESTPSTTTSE
jgi:hypothetical protein